MSLSLMTWNVRYFGHGTRGLSATTRRLHAIASAIAPAPPDLIALQEVEDVSLRAGRGRGVPQHERFTDALHAALAARGSSRRYRAVYFPAHRYQLPVGPAVYTTGLQMLVADGLEIAAHNAEIPHDITHVRLPWFSRFKQTRIAGWIRVQGDHGSLDLVNTHLSLPAFLEVGPHRVPRAMGDGSNQVQEMRRLLSFVEGLGGDGRTVIVGDFNARPGSAAHQTLVDAGFLDAFAATTGKLDHATARFMSERMHIDHVFSGPAVQWLGFDDHSVESGPFAGLSDHAPKVGHLRIH